MALSRIAGFTLVLALAAPAQAQTDPLQGALDAQREIVRSAASSDCGPGADGEIVVCGRREEEEQARRFRVEPTPPAAGIGDRAGGAQRHAMAANDQRCTPIGRAQQCSGGLDVLAIAFGAVRIVQALRARRD